MPEKIGLVYIVGAGPGDYGLITLKGLECIKAADVLIYDRLVNEKYLGLAKDGCELIYAGKQSSDHAIPQDRLNELIADKAAEGRIVTRLKGGDPYIFGRGGEEALLLRERGIPFEVVPGVSAFSAVPAYAGIPVTHRGYASTAAVITGHEDPAKETSDINWRALAGIGTLVFFMGVKNLAKISENLVAAGMPETTPAALIERGTTPLQKSLISDLKNIAAAAAEKNIKPPSILVVGKTAELGGRLNWFENRPLSGRKIIVTRAREQASELSAQLERLGAMVYETPMIRLVPPDDGYESLKTAMAEISRYQMIVFTSVNGVSRFFERAAEFGHDIRILSGLSIAAIGEKTADALRARYLNVDIVPGEYKAENLAEKIIETHKSKKLDILVARAQNARDTLVEALREAGHRVSVAHVYKTVHDAAGPFDIKEMLASGEIDVLTFASSSTVDNFMIAAGAGAVTDAVRNNGLKIAAIGPITASTCAKYGVEAAIKPAQYTIDALAGEIAAYYAARTAETR
ncbi:MAG: uroporphyrinogen-III C-methyltransferase [Candidatus Wallbacteria bacterium GWC2_49_35]|uniref:uroporphyrinogen-III C-methyltransferase n=1 Tax=Candidatus Wallbacteria bacterium GWC2_49_35 TaxID=1817813 RepID=A0A1F7WVG4_9BACT|nr:MAG: uroporphyrinogen-III C-methyltransferase [Candidatus Wallbacteria bacterium GWC2_49_35]HBC73298.1 uroporphyrinogen-III C-methyltransferase [Candidatus Wallbacteria bacterium]